MLRMPSAASAPNEYSNAARIVPMSPAVSRQTETRPRSA